MTRFAAGVVVVRQHADGWRCLLLRAYGYWDFAKGSLEPGEGPLAAAIREVAEETGLTGLRFRWGDAFRETEAYSGGKMARYYVAESASGAASLPVSPELGRPEHHELRWVSFPEAKRLVVPRLQRIVEWAEGLVDAPQAPGRSDQS